MADPPPLLPEDVFSDLPDRLREELLDSFGKIVQNFSEHRWEPAELNGGKLCEVVYSIAKGMIDGQYPASASKPRNMVQACQQLEQSSGSSAPRSVRIQIPRMLVALYEVRNNRNVGHVGGEVDPSHMDAVCVLQMSKWIVAELIRVLHHRPVEEASALVDALVERETPIVWKVGGKKRVLDTKLSMKDKALVLLHATSGTVTEAELVAWVEHSNASVFRRDVLRRAHKEKLIEYDAGSRTVDISPLGVEHAERLLAARNAAG
ncbi:hypothetical protein OJ997_01880 [Solirubrobacter phytolaccae]|uniref:Uncharacterized protein n=1 Tax=Solirubrobacter phytolaccae TaxID=1404360 RepID=A0A9X3S6F0_9ACTN|nr:hypothetical protein [Solirubrobacter phytolaccae]MDA0179028.1 hypothetical protein [Solirubrobacter phytolaccae]